MDVDAFVTAHRGEWERLRVLTQRAGRPGGLSGAEVDELLDLYQRAATHLSLLRTRLPDPQAVASLSALVTRARAAVAGGHTSSWSEARRFVVVTLPAALYRTWRWWAGAAAATIAVSFGIGAWIATHPSVQAKLAPPDAIRQLVDHDFEDYYSAHPAAAFAGQVWTHNVWVAAGCLVLGVLLGIPTVYLLWGNAVNIGLSGGLMAANGKLGLFFGLIVPHGLLELTAVFVAAGVGLRLGWTVVDPGHRKRTDALAAEGRAAIGVTIGLVGMLAVSGVIEAFVTPSGLPTAARVAIGVLVEAAFLTYVIVLGRRAVREGETGDVEDGVVAVPVAG